MRLSRLPQPQAELLKQALRREPAEFDLKNEMLKNSGLDEVEQTQAVPALRQRYAKRLYNDLLQ